MTPVTERSKTEAPGNLRAVRTTNFPARLPHLSPSLRTTAFQAGTLELVHSVRDLRAGSLLRDGGAGQRYSDLINDDERKLENSFVVRKAVLTDVSVAPLRRPNRPVSRRVRAGTGSCRAGIREGVREAIYHQRLSNQECDRSMFHNSARYQRRDGRGTVEARKRWRLQPTLLALEDRKLLSSIIVNNPTDTPIAGQTDLRQAIVQANTAGGDQTITFEKKVFKSPQTITLDPTQGQLELSDTTGTETITGPKAGVTVSGGGLSRVFQVDGMVSASISGLTITGGSANDGGGLLNLGTTTLTNCTVSGSTATASYPYGGQGGGGIDSQGGTLVVKSCAFINNSAPAGGGGAIEVSNLNSPGSLSVSGSTFTGNVAGGGGGAIQDAWTTMTVSNSTFTSNSAGFGGAIDNGSSNGIVSNSNFTTNSGVRGSDQHLSLLAGNWPGSVGEHVQRQRGEQRPGRGNSQRVGIRERRDGHQLRVHREPGRRWERLWIGRRSDLQALRLSGDRETGSRPR